jgi:hypothetical protein
MKRAVMTAVIALALLVAGVALRAGTTGAVTGDDKQPASAIALPSLPSNSSVKVDLDAGAAAPRALEDTTEKAIVRDYANAWSVMASAVENNSVANLASGFTGSAQQRLAERVQQQRRAGLRTRYVDHGHKLQAVFYSPEGSAMQLHDTAKLEEQVLDGETVVSSREVTANYAVLMTVGEERWKVRLLQELPQP